MQRLRKQPICKYCKEDAEHECEVCGSGKNNICFTHKVYFDIGMTLNQRSLLKLSNYKKHPQFFACLNDKGTGCAVPIVKAMLENMGKKVKTKKVNK